jgi:competence protein ComEC
VADSGQQYGGHAYHDCIETAHNQRVPVVYPRAGTIWKSDDGVTLYFVGPQLPFLKNTGNDINDNSITFILAYKHFRMLFTGDAGFAAEQRFLKTGIDLRANVLKVGHHGSAYSSSSEFLAAVHPHDAIISVGRHNHFGHPALRTLAALVHLHANVYRTDQNAAVMVSTNGLKTNVTTLIRAYNGRDL